MILRDYQLRAIESLRARVREAARRLLLVAPTGAGKTVIVADLIRRAITKGSKVLFIAHRREILEQTSAKLQSLDISHGWILSGYKPSFMAEVNLASIQTLIRRGLPEADIVVWDECHHIRAKSYQDVMAKYPQAIHIGLTATPVRSDGRGLGSSFEAMCQPVSYQELIGKGYLVPAKCFAPSEPDLAGVKMKGGDYDEDQLAERMDKPKLVGDIVTHWEKLAGHRTTLVFAVNVAHALHIQEAFANAGYAFEQLDGESDIHHRQRVVGQLSRGEISGIVNVGLFTEGTDIPSVSCIVLARPTASFGLYRQIVGRGLRSCEGKTNCLVLDHAGAVMKHGLPTQDVIWELTEDKKPWKIVEKSAKEKKMIEWPCGFCRHINVTRTPFCAECGQRMMKVPKGLAVVDGVLEEIKESTRIPCHTMEEKARLFAQLKRYAETHGYFTGWASHQYRELTGVWPNHPSIKQAVSESVNPEIASWIKHRQIRYAKSRAIQQEEA